MRLHVNLFKSSDGRSYVIRFPPNAALKWKGLLSTGSESNHSNVITPIVLETGGLNFQLHEEGTPWLDLWIKVRSYLAGDHDYVFLKEDGSPRFDAA
jgi:hypothetical protein